MTLRHYVTCDICIQPITLRILIGHSDVQDHNFNCPHCSAEIGIKLNLNQQQGTWSFAEHRKISVGDTEGIIVNLNPGFIVSKDDLHAENSFHWMEQLHKFMDLASDGMDDDDTDENPPHRRIATDVEWQKHIYPIWNSLKNKRHDIISNRLKIPMAATTKTVEKEALDRLFGFTNTLCYKSHNSQSERIRALLFDLSYRNPNQDFINRYNQNWKASFTSNFDTFLNKYFKNYRDISQMHLYNLSGLEIPESAVPTSFDFVELKEFYSEVYEIIGSRSEIYYHLFCIMNNQTPDFLQFSASSKALRHPFFCTKFQFLKEMHQMKSYLKPIIRNSISHSSNRITPEGLLEFTDNYKGRTRTEILTKTEFLNLCSTASSFLASMFLGEIELQYHMLK